MKPRTRRGRPWQLRAHHRRGREEEGALPLHPRCRGKRRAGSGEKRVALPLPPHSSHPQHAAVEPSSRVQPQPQSQPQRLRQEESQPSPPLPPSPKRRRRQALRHALRLLPPSKQGCRGRERRFGCQIKLKGLHPRQGPHRCRLQRRERLKFSAPLCNYMIKSARVEVEGVRREIGR